MTPGSLRLRLLAGAAFSIAVTLSLLFFGISILFERHVERRIRNELEQFVLQIAGSIDTDGKGAVTLDSEISDDRFRRPLSGYYWQIEADGSIVHRSTSLWDQSLPPLADDDPPGQFSAHHYVLPDLGSLEAICKTVSVDNGPGQIRISLQVAIDQKEIAQPLAEFRADIGLAMGLIGLVLVAGAAVQVLVGLRPLRQLREQVKAVRGGTVRRIDGVYPGEVTSLVEELNGVLDAQEKSVERARSRAGDLAHGLKTPLTILAGLARSLKEQGRPDDGDAIASEIESMRRHVERQLARARIATGRSRTVTPLRPATDKVIGALRRIPKGDALEWRNQLATGDTAAIDPDDLDEVLGNLLDNARNWARHVVVVAVRDDAEGRQLCVEDDGPGVPDESLTTIIERGERLDESHAGSGLGLAIVSDIASAYGVPLTAYRSQLGGLGIRFGLPAIKATDG